MKALTLANGVTTEVALNIDGEPTGFLDRTSSTLSFNDSTRTFTITPVGSFSVYFSGSPVTFSTPQSQTIPNTSGIYFFYFDRATGALTVASTFSEDIISTHVFASVVAWNAVQGKHVYFADERHGLVMDGATHLHLHTSLGAQYISGLGLGDFTVDASGDLNAHAQFSVANGVIRDEDLKFSIIDGAPQDIAPIANLPILYRIGTTWYRTIADVFPVITPAKATYTNTGRIAYNLLSGGNWSLAEVANNEYTVVHVLATNDIEFPIQAVAGGTYNTISAARDGALQEFKTYTGLPFTEFVLLGTVVYEAANSYTNSPKARIRSVDTAGSTYIDWRKQNPFGVGATAGGGSSGSSATQRTFGFFIG